MGRTLIRISVVLCLQIGLALSQDLDGLFLFVRDDQAKCVAAGDAFSPSLYWLHNVYLRKQNNWNIQKQEELLEINSYANYTTSSSSCKYQDRNKDNSRCQGVWDLDIADFSKSDFPVLDERWENLPLEVTKRESSKDGSDVRPPPHGLPSGSWTRGVSILSTESSYIMLCDGDDPFSSNCYWLIINGWPDLKPTPYKSALRYCPYTMVVPQTGYPGPPCSNIRTEHLGWIGPTDDWLHLKLAWDHERSELKVSYLTDQSEELPFITYANTNITLGITHMILRSDKDNKFWRINHNYVFDLREGTSSFTSIRARFNTFNTNCLLINYSIQGVNETESFTGHFLRRQSGVKVKIILQGFLGENDFKISSGSLYINSVEDCQKSERSLDLDMKTYTNKADISCASLTQPPRRVTYKQPSAPGPKAHAMFRLCTKLYGDCAKTFMCDEKSCVCAPGYQGYMCQYNCPDRKVGFQCMFHCSANCKDRCSDFDGTCGTCVNAWKYRPPFCNETHPYVKKAPEIIDSRVGPQNPGERPTIVATIKFNYKDINGGGRPTHFVPQLQIVVDCIADTKTTQWKSRGRTSLPAYGSETEFSLADLQASTFYKVRVILQEDSYNSYDNADVPTQCFKTPCKPDVYLEIKPDKKSAVITPMQDNPTAVSCAFSMYWLQWSTMGTVTEVKTLGLQYKTPIPLDQLTPYTNYHVRLFIQTKELNHSKEFQFTTQEDDKDGLFLFVRDDQEAKCVAAGDAFSPSLYWLHKGYTTEQSYWNIKKQQELLEINSYANYITSNSSCTYQDRNKDNSRCQGVWELNSSDFSKTDFPVLDERWEDIPLEVTKRTSTKDGSDVRPPPHQLPTGSWTRGVSVLSTESSFILLCDGADPFSSSCYWLIINGWPKDGNKSALRYCPHTMAVPKTGYPDHPCSNIRTEHLGWIGPKNDWLHLKLAWDHKLRELKVSYRTDQSEELQFITYANTNIYRDMTHMILRSEKDNKFWRINQNYGSNLREETSGFNFIRERFNNFNTNCLFINYSNQRRGTVSFTGQFLRIRKEGKEEIILQRSLHDKSFENLWGSLYINSVDECKNSVRLLDLDMKKTRTNKEDITCASLTQPRKTVQYRLPSGPGPEAHEAMFQLCTKLHGDCAMTLMCDEKSCVCAPGYWGYICQEKCQDKSYGFQCGLQCNDKCFCNHIDGKCEKCIDTFKYKLPFCNETYPYLKYKPVRVITGPQSKGLEDIATLTFKFNSKDIIGSGQPKYYSPQWKEVDACDMPYREWTSGDKTTLPVYGGDDECILYNLKASTIYQVRVLLYEDGTDYYYDQEDIPTTCAKTSCIPDLNLVIYPEKRNATVTAKLDHRPESSCPLQEYKWKLLASQEKTNSYKNLRKLIFMGDTLTLEKLSPYTSYSVQLVIESEELNDTKAYPFTTLEDAPSAPLSLTLTSVSEGQVTLEWKRPEETNGKLRKFRISFKVVNSTLLYKYPKPKDEYLDVTEDKDLYSMSVSGLSASTWYEITVSGVTISEGDKALIYVRTTVAEPTFGSLKKSVTPNSSGITLPPADGSLAKDSSYFMLVKSESGNVENDTAVFYNPSLKKDVLKNANITDLYPNAWIAAELQPSNTSTEWIVGDNTSVCSIHVHKCLNRPLLPDNNYTLYVVLMNGDGHIQRFVGSGSFLFRFYIPRLHEGSGGGLYFLILLLVILPVIIWVVFRYNRQKPFFTRTNILKERSPRRGGVNVDAPALLRPPLPEPMVECQMAMTDARSTSTPATPATATTIKQQSCRVKIADLKDYIKTLVVTGELSHQFTMFPRGQVKPWEYGRLPQNRQKNRYGNLLAYDEFRVVLEKLPNEPFSDYINATYIDGFNVPRMYIASQGPKALTMGDFWRMIWQEKVQVISMVTNLIENGKTKCDQYWPERGVTVTHGGVTITAGHVQVLADYTIRQFHVKKDEESRKLTQLHFTSWPDHGVPLYIQSVASYLKRLLATPRGSGPILVHCSAGVGRTGTIVVLDACLRMAAAEGVVDVLRLLQQTREQRANMVDNLEQYKLIHHVLEECLVTEPTAITCDSGFRTKIDKLRESGGMEKQFARVMMNQPAARDVDLVEHRRLYGTKDRVPGVVPSKTGRIYLSRLPESGAETSDYINAVSVDGFQCKNQFVATQFPLPTTVKDFWRLIAEQHVSVIIVLHQVDESSKNVCKFWPVAGETLRPTKSLTVTLKSEVDDPSWISRTFCASVFNDSDVDNAVDEWQVKMLHLKTWPSTDLLPSDTDPASLLIELWEETERIYRGKEPIVVCCLDGAHACGLFLSLAFVIEKVKLEQECDVCQAVHVVRYNRSQFISTQDQFEWLFEAAHKYLESFQTYANFQELQSKY